MGLFAVTTGDSAYAGVCSNRYGYGYANYTNYGGNNCGVGTAMVVVIMAVGMVVDMTAVITIATGITTAINSQLLIRRDLLVKLVYQVR